MDPVDHDEQQQELDLLDDSLPILDEKEMEDLYRHFLLDEMPEPLLPEHEASTQKMRAYLVREVACCAQNAPSNAGRAADDDGDEDFEPSPIEVDEEEEDEEAAGVRRRNIQARELNDLLRDAYKQLGPSIVPPGLRERVLDQLSMHFQQLVQTGILAAKMHPDDEQCPSARRVLGMLEHLACGSNRTGNEARRTRAMGKTASIWWDADGEGLPSVGIPGLLPGETLGEEIQGAARMYCTTWTTGVAVEKLMTARGGVVWPQLLPGMTPECAKQPLHGLPPKSSRRCTGFSQAPFSGRSEGPMRTDGHTSSSAGPTLSSQSSSFSMVEDRLLCRGVHLHRMEWDTIKLKFLPHKPIQMLQHRYAILSGWGSLTQQPPRPKPGPQVFWTEEEDLKLRDSVLKYGHKWARIAREVMPHRGRTAIRCRWASLEERIGSSNTWRVSKGNRAVGKALPSSTVGSNDADNGDSDETEIDVEEDAPVVESAPREPPPSPSTATINRIIPTSKTRAGGAAAVRPVPSILGVLPPPVPSAEPAAPASTKPIQPAPPRPPMAAPMPGNFGLHHPLQMQQLRTHPGLVAGNVASLAPPAAGGSFGLPQWPMSNPLAMMSPWNGHAPGVPPLGGFSPFVGFPAMQAMQAPPAKPLGDTADPLGIPIPWTRRGRAGRAAAKVRKSGPKSRSGTANAGTDHPPPEGAESGKEDPRESSRKRAVSETGQQATRPQQKRRAPGTPDALDRSEETGDADAAERASRTPPTDANDAASAENERTGNRATARPSKDGRSTNAVYAEDDLSEASDGSDSVPQDVLEVSDGSQRAASALAADNERSIPSTREDAEQARQTIASRVRRRNRRPAGGIPEEEESSEAEALPSDDDYDEDELSDTAYAD